MPVTSQFAHRGPLAPIFQRAALPGPRASVQPLTVFAARKASFDVIVRKLVLAEPALVLIFDALPLEENGWDFPTVSISRAGTSSDKWPIWRVSREC